jgi:hypothetical protein
MRERRAKLYLTGKRERRYKRERTEGREGD